MGFLSVDRVKCAWDNRNMKRLCWLMIPVLLCAAGCSQKAEKSLFAMDTYCTIEAYGASAEAAVTAAGRSSRGSTGCSP